MIIKFAAFFFLTFIYMLHLEAEESYILEFQNTDGGSISLNGFVFDASNSTKWHGKSVLFCLKQGRNVISLSETHGKAFLRITAPKQTSTPIYSILLDSSSKSVVKTFFHLVKFQFQWSWEKSETITTISPSDEAMILELVKRFVGAYRNGKMDAIFYETLAYKFKDMTSSRGKKNADGARKAFNWFYSTMLSPVVRKSFSTLKGKLKVTPTINKHLIRVTRENNAPIFIIHDATGSEYILTDIYFIRIHGKWYII